MLYLTFSLFRKCTLFSYSLQYSLNVFKVTLVLAGFSAFGTACVDKKLMHCNAVSVSTASIYHCNIITVGALFLLPAFASVRI